MALFSLPAPLTMPLARQRLKSNLGALALLTFARTLFSPYLYLRSLLISSIDWFAANPRVQHGSDIVWYLEMAITLVLVYNVAESAYWVQHPNPIPATPAGLKLVPILKSSPLTRGYPPTSDLGSGAAAQFSTPPRNATQSPLAQSLYKSTATPPRNPATPERSSPLSTSTARVLNLQQQGTPSQTGLFYEENSAASPAKAALGASAGHTSSPLKTSRGPTAPSLDREEREWVDNVWRGVRGKSRKVGL